jgi:hypothetical protein
MSASSVTVPTPGLDESEVPLFDVTVKMPPGARLEDIQHLAEAAGIRPDRVEALVNALRSSPQAKIGAGVDRERANKAKEQFTKAGLMVEVTPVLTLGMITAAAFDGLTACPSCSQRVALPENRQCPNCGVFVDKITDEALLRRKILEQERNKLDFQASRDAKNADKQTREQLEASLRAKVREELEAKYGGKRRAQTSVFKLAGVTGLLALAFIGGRAGSTSGWSMEQLLPGSKARGSSPAEVNKMLDAVGPQTAAASKAAAGAAGGAAAAAGGAGTATGDPDIDDPLIRAAGGDRIGKEGISIEQAVAAAGVLAKSVGNTTAQRAMSGESAGPSAAGTDPAGAAAVASQGPAAAAATGATSGAVQPGVQAASASPTPAAGGAAAPLTVSAESKLLLSVAFARQLAEMGQTQRGLVWMKALKASPKLAAEPVAASAARVADMEIQAWAMQSLAEGRARQAADALMTQAQALPDAAERTQALSRLGAILARQPQLPPEASRAFLTQAAESLKQIDNAQQRNAAASDWAVCLGEALMAQAGMNARAGSWSQVKAAADQIARLIEMAPDASAQMRLHAIDSQVRQQLGQRDKAAHSLDAALALAARTPNLADRAVQLRTIARLSDSAASERMQAVLRTTETEAASKAGLERAQALSTLALAHADAGLRSKLNELTRQAQATSGLSAADTVAVTTELIFRSDMATARLLHSIGLYAEAETILQRLGGYLT